MSELVQPVTLTLPQEWVRGNFALLNCHDVPDPLWQFQVAVSKTARYEPPQFTAADADKMQLLARFRGQEPAYVVEIAGQSAPFEIDAADFLDAWLEVQAEREPFTVMSRNTVARPGGHVGDVVVSGETSGAAWAGRVVCLKYGPRLVLISFRTALADYNALAETFFVALMTFRMTDDSPGVLAEKIRPVSSMIPTPWKTAVPASCTIRPNPGDTFFSEFQADLMAPADPNPIAIGHLTYTVLAPDLVRDSAHALETVVSAVKSAGITVAPADPKTETPNAPYTEAWSLVTSAQLLTGPGELRIRVVRHPKAWVCAAVVGPARAVSVPVWLRNKRLLDLVTTMTEIA